MICLPSRRCRPSTAISVQLSLFNRARAHVHRVRGNRWADDPAAIAEMKRKAPGAVGACFGLIEREMPGLWAKPVRSATPICSPRNGWRSDDVDLSRLPRMIDRRNSMSERPTVVCRSAQRLRVSGFALRPSRHPSRRRRGVRTEHPGVRYRRRRRSASTEAAGDRPTRLDR
jgi:hypothetical protein